MNSKSLYKYDWWKSLDEDLQELLLESFKLAEVSAKWEDEYHDYAFIVFPAAKAYEGFLKGLFLDLGFITQEDYEGKHFRIGKALNPSLEKSLREKESVYDKIVLFCNDPQLANKLWSVWKNSRNLLFHWFPNEKNSIGYRDAVERVSEIVDAFDMAYHQCKMK